MKNNLEMLVLLALFNNFNLFAPMPPKPPTIGAYPYDWKYASIGETDVQVWRKEMNYWYDRCADFNDDTNDDMPIGEKADLFLSNKKLESENNLLHKKIELKYPNICKKDYYDLGVLEIEKDVELNEIKKQALSEGNANKKNPEIERLKEQLKALDNDYVKLNDLCDKKGYIPSKIDEPLSYIEKRKIKLEHEYTEVIIKIANERGEKIKDLQDELTEANETIKDLENEKKEKNKKLRAEMKRAFGYK